MAPATVKAAELGEGAQRYHDGMEFDYSMMFTEVWRLAVFLLCLYLLLLAVAFFIAIPTTIAPLAFF